MLENGNFTCESVSAVMWACSVLRAVQEFSLFSDGLITILLDQVCCAVDIARFVKASNELDANIFVFSMVLNLKGSCDYTLRHSLWCLGSTGLGTGQGSNPTQRSESLAMSGRAIFNACPVMPCLNDCYSLRPRISVAFASRETILTKYILKKY